MIPGLTPGCIAGFVWAALNVLVPPNSWGGVGVCTAVGILCYLTILLTFCLEPKDREDLTVLIAKCKNAVRVRVSVFPTSPASPAYARNPVHVSSSDRESSSVTVCPD